MQARSVSWNCRVSDSRPGLGELYCLVKTIENIVVSMRFVC